MTAETPAPLVRGGDTTVNVAAAFNVPPELVEELARRAAQLAAEERRDTAPDCYLTVPEAARYIGATPQRIYDLRSSGRLTRYADGSRALVRRDELDAHVAPR